jgi:hypothetical protein
VENDTTVSGNDTGVSRCEAARFVSPVSLALLPAQARHGSTTLPMVGPCTSVIYTGGAPVGVLLMDIQQPI